MELINKRIIKNKTFEAYFLICIIRILLIKYTNNSGAFLKGKPPPPSWLTQGFNKLIICSLIQSLNSFIIECLYEKKRNNREEIKQNIILKKVNIFVKYIQQEHDTPKSDWYKE